MTAIPRIIHRLWLSPPGPPMPRVFREFGDRIRELMPDWELHDWTSFDALPDLHPHTTDLVDRADGLYPFDRHRFVADLVRLEVLWNEGGVYLDTDVQVRKPLDRLVGFGGFVAARSPQSIGGVHPITNAVMASPAGDPFVKTLIDRLPLAVAVHGTKQLARAVGPWHLHRVYAERAWPDVTVLPYTDLYGPDSEIVHLWHSAMRRAGRGLDDKTVAR